MGRPNRTAPGGLVYHVLNSIGSELFNLSLIVLTPFPGLDVLKCKTVDGVLRELNVFALVYNMVRQVMLAAAYRQEVDVRRISFIDALRWLQLSRPGDELPKLVVLPHRPNRLEPRVIKRRPKTYSLMNKPRKQLKKELASK